jgi:hypothetical protein
MVMSLVFVVLMVSPNPDVTLGRALQGNLAIALGPVFPFVVMGSLISPFVIRALCLAIVLLLTAAGVGLWRNDQWAFRLELMLLSTAGACLFGSGAILLLFRPVIGILHFTLAALAGTAGWHLSQPALSARRFGLAVAAVLAAALLIFGSAAAFVLRGLSGLR